MQAGDRLAHYEILGPIGSGGMGEVYRARDTRLDREVAIKVLPDDLAADPERLARFRREAKVLASLNHTNVAAIHGLEQEGDRLFLAMELAPGETLAARMDRGAVPVDEAVAIAVQIAAGLEEAHAKGVVHRDLKPANVKLGPDGQVKILDFGLARAYLGEESAAGDPDHSPTLTAAMTQAGVILGTAAYMSPEQARGHAVDSRTDVWAFGVILWEMLAGRRLFAGETVSDTVAMVLRGDPDWDALPADLPPSLRRLLQRCLQRDRRQRLHHIADARIVLEEIQRDGTSAHEAEVSGPVPASRPRRRWAGASYAVLALLVVAILGLQAFSGGKEQTPARTARFDLTVPEGTWIGDQRQALAVAPSGDLIAIALSTPAGSQLYLRELEDPVMRPIPGTENAATPFFSPDGRWLAFTQEGRLRKVALDGGSPVDICDTEWGGGTWTEDGHIILTRSYAGGLSIVSAAGGALQALTEPDTTHGELGHWWPDLLPGDEWVIYTGWSTPIDRSRILAYSLKSGETHLLAEGGAFGRWSPTGHLLYLRNGKLMAAPLDPRSATVTGPAEPVLDDVYLHPNDGYATLALADDGTLVYAAASVMELPRSLVWADRQGNLTPLDVPPRRYITPVLSPEGRRLAVTIADGHDRDVWLHDLERGTWSRFTFSKASDFNPLWTPDGRTLLFNGEEPQFTIYRRPADGSAEPTRLRKEAVDLLVSDVSPDGKTLVYTRSDTETDSDIWTMPLDSSGEPQPFLVTRFSETMGTVSPDGRWLAYVSNESGRSEVYAMAFPGGGSRLQISVEGGTEPVWSPAGDEIFFRSRAGLVAAPIDRDRTTSGQLVVGRPEVLFNGPFDDDWVRHGYDVTADGQRFLMVHLPEDSRPRTLRVVLNWFTDLQRTVVASR